MSIFQRTEIVDKNGVLHVFTQHEWNTTYEAFDHCGSAAKSAEEILRLPAEIKYSMKYLNDMDQSVTMPTITRFTKKVSYESLPGLSGKNPHRTISIGRAKAILMVRYQ